MRPLVPRRLHDQIRGPSLAFGRASTGEQRIDILVLKAEENAVITPYAGVPTVVAVLGRGLAAAARGHLDGIERSDVLAVATQQKLHLITYPSARLADWAADEPRPKNHRP
jgi:hypothetical protein